MQSRSQIYSVTDPTPIKLTRFFRSGLTAAESKDSMLLVIGRPWKMGFPWGSLVWFGSGLSLYLVPATRSYLTIGCSSTVFATDSRRKYSIPVIGTLQAWSERAIDDEGLGITYIQSHTANVPQTTTITNLQTRQFQVSASSSLD